MTPGSSHVHKVRTVVNSQYSHKDLVALSGWSKAYTKQKFESAMAIFKVRDHINLCYFQSITMAIKEVLVAPLNITQHKVTEMHSNSWWLILISILLRSREVLLISTNKSTTVGQIHIAKDARAVSGEADSNPVHKQLQASTVQVSECYPVDTSNRFQVLDNNQDVLVNTLGEVDSQSIDSHAHEQQLHVYSSIQQMIVEPDPNMTIADPSSVPEYQKCKEQIGTKFGCVPLAPIYVYKGPTRYWVSIPDIVTAHKLIRQSGLPNFLDLGYRFEPT